ncbi:tRNA pseudouridine(38-40) synthase TruA [Desulfosoma caldarium]|uniref:tRNA pseudouridine synthase A n=1 Tax=Desulfosoma caldarium TaxID=610254 RepID=A0A3N1URZ5_9BACT|nr:tRNA pseudouridine(38-40) synthase TruA [Desulfosoma caldarium]ROQ89856.1 tRNA pseudouridine38-40 synthase [Desulfosoma caldarium]
MAAVNGPFADACPSVKDALEKASMAFDPQRKRNFKLVLEYDGSHYHGWQRQKGVLTLQEVVESKLGIMLGRPVTVRASGRTDAGVHALGQVINFYARTRLTPQDFQRGLNGLLPPDIVVRHAEEVPDSFHASYSAVSKTYEYRILNRPLPSALERLRAWHVPKPLELEKIQQCLPVLLGTRDFRAFMAAGSSVTQTVRTMMAAHAWRPDADHLYFRFQATGFLRHMVRNLVGTLVQAGRGLMGPEELEAILESRDRSRAGITAPAHGLYLVCVDYGREEKRNAQQRGDMT